MGDKLAALTMKAREDNHPMPLHVKIPHPLALVVYVNAEAGERPDMQIWARN
jgi:hypothetical protein